MSNLFRRERHSLAGSSTSDRAFRKGGAGGSVVSCYDSKAR